MHLGSRSESFIRVKETFPVHDLGATGCENPFTADARPSLHTHNTNLGKMRAACSGRRSHISLQKASLAQKQVESLPTTIGFAPTLNEERSLSERPRREGARQLQHVPPSPQLQLDLVQLRAEIAHLKEMMQELAGQSFRKKMADNNNENNNDNNNINNNNTTTNNNNNNNNDNNNNDNNTNSQRSSLQSLDQKKASQESGLNSFDLDNENPETELSSSDLDTSSLGSFDPLGYAESSFSSPDQQEATYSLDKQCLGTLGQPMMTIGFSLGSLNPRNQERRMDRDSFEKKKHKKKVSFSKEALAAYKAKQENDNNQNKGSHPGSLQLEQLRHNNQQQSWHNEPRRMQQQSAAASEKKLEHRPCNDYNLDSEEGTLGSLEQNASTTNLRADRSPKLNNNTSTLGQDLKNTAAWGILVDTGAAMSLAPMSFAPSTELSPLQSTIKLRTVTGNEIEAFGYKTVHLVGRELSLTISFVIASVEHVVLGFDVLLTNQLSIVMGNNGEIHLVNQAGAKTQLRNKGHLLYLDAWPMDSGFETCNWSSLPSTIGSLLDDKNGTHQEPALHTELDNQDLSSSGGADVSSFSLENLRQHKSTTSLGATALNQGAKKRNKKKPSAKRASHNQLSQPA